MEDDVICETLNATTMMMMMEVVGLVVTDRADKLGRMGIVPPPMPVDLPVVDEPPDRSSSSSLGASLLKSSSILASSSSS